MPAPPGGINVPAPAPKAHGQRATYDAYVKAHPALKAYAQGIWDAAVKYNVDPIYYASLILFESGGKPNARSSANAYGLAQIHIPSWLGATDPRDGTKITQAEINNPTWNLGFGAYLFKQALNNYGSYDAAYRNGYNSGYTGKGPFKDIPKGYVVQGGGQSPQERAQTSVETSAAKQQITDPWVVLGKGGQVSYVFSAVPPKNALRSGGLPVTRSVFFQTTRDLNNTYSAYLGREATPKEVAQYMARPTSTYQLQTNLSQRSGFIGSPIWKQNAPSYESVWHKVYGDTSTPDRAAVTDAIVHNLGGDAFADTLRARQDYMNSNEFKQGFVAFQGVYQQIYGKPNTGDNQVIAEAVRNGWDQNQFASFLRAQPAYTSSSEFHSKALAFADALGLFTGQKGTLTPGAQAAPTQTVGGPSDAANVPGSPQPLQRPSDLVVG